MESKESYPELFKGEQENIAYEYLCHLQEVKLWMESILKESIPPITELEENLRNGVYLARLGNLIAPDEVPLSRIYDIFQHRYRNSGLQFKHTDNINYWIKALIAVNFPKIFHPETMDIYNKKNMPKVIYCIHALSKHLFKLGKAPSIQDLYGKIEFDRDDIDFTCHELKKYDIQIPSFKRINNILNDELGNCDHTILHEFIQEVNDAIDIESNGKLLECLNSPSVKLVHVLPENLSEYMIALKNAKKEKRLILQNRSLRDKYEPDLYENLLSQSEIQGYIRSVNSECLWREIEISVISKNEEKLKILLPKISSLELKDFNSDNIDLYTEIFLKLDIEKLKFLTRSNTPSEIIRGIIKNGNRMRKERIRVSEGMTEIKKAIVKRDLSAFSKALRNPALQLSLKFSNENATLYFEHLETCLKNSKDLSYYDVKTVVNALNQTTNNSFRNSILTDSSYKLSTAEVPDKHVSKNTKLARTNVFNQNYQNNADMEKFIVKLQARIRGFQLRRTMNKMKGCWIIQSNMVHVEEEDGKILNETEENFISKFYLKNIDKIVKIQALWRGYRIRKLLKSKSLSNNITKFMAFRQLAIAHKDIDQQYSDLLRLQALKSSVVETIKINQELASQLEEIDVKIGLLVHNRMSIQNLVADGKRLPDSPTSVLNPKGIKIFTRETRAIFDKYRQLFYILQTDPSYLTRLITRLPAKSTQIIQSCVLSLFNYGASSRDAYLLLRLFRSALIEEVKCKFQRPIDAIRGNPLVLRLALGFSRQYEGYNSLRNILGFLIESVLNDKTYIDTNPVDIYLRWINKMETETGKPSQLPTNVTREEALSYPEVSEQLHHNLKILKTWVKTFLKRITVCANMFPYALRFIAQVLWKALKERFPEASEKDIIKIIGNLVFYHYINSAIVAPDSFYIISLPPNQHLKPEQRRNLASIAKILQFAASKKGFGEEYQHLTSMNPFIISCHEVMKHFCKKCCAVEDLEEHFNITDYSEAVLIEKPKIYITIEEICECHKILYQERHQISQDPLDPILNILHALGEPPSVATLTGCSAKEAVTYRAGKTQICLELDNKFQLPPEDVSDTEKLFIKTKELIISKISVMNGRTLKEAIEKEHFDIATNLKLLEEAGMVKNSNDYTSIIDSLIKDITQQQQYQQNLKKEIRKLTLDQQRLDEKKNYYEDQLSCYKQYLNTCLDSLTKSNRAKEQRCAKYSAKQLIEKGILASLEGVPSDGLKNVQFEIATTEFNGIYSVRGRFMGVEIERINLDVQDLLQFQFEGRPIMDLKDNGWKAKINVNLLLYLLNKKFHDRL